MDFVSMRSRDVYFINTTPHEIKLVWADGEEFTLQPSGILVNAKVLEEDAGKHSSGAALVRTRFSVSEADSAKLDEIEAAHPGCVILGSIIAAQAFPEGFWL